MSEVWCRQDTFTLCWEQIRQSTLPLDCIFQFYIHWLGYLGSVDTTKRSAASQSMSTTVCSHWGSGKPLHFGEKEVLLPKPWPSQEKSPSLELCDCHSFAPTQHQWCLLPAGLQPDLQAEPPIGFATGGAKHPVRVLMYPDPSEST